MTVPFGPEVGAGDAVGFNVPIVVARGVAVGAEVGKEVGADVGTSVGTGVEIAGEFEEPQPRATPMMATSRNDRTTRFIMSDIIHWNCEERN